MGLSSGSSSFCCFLEPSGVIDHGRRDDPDAFDDGWPDRRGLVPDDLNLILTQPALFSKLNPLVD